MPKVNLAAMGEANSNKAKDPKDTPKEREQRTVREMAMMQLLRHPNICQLKEWISEGDYYYMFLEYVDGGQLLDYIISHGKLREKQARKFARQIVSALGKVYQTGDVLQTANLRFYGGVCAICRLLSPEFHCASR